MQSDFDLSSTQVKLVDSILLADRGERSIMLKMLLSDPRYEPYLVPYKSLLQNRLTHLKDTDSWLLIASDHRTTYDSWSDPFVQALRNKMHEVTAYCIQKFQDSDVEELRGHTGLTSVAAVNEDLKSLVWLMDNGFLPEEEDILTVCVSGKLNVLKLMLVHADPVSKWKDGGHYALVQIVQGGNFENLIHLLSINPADLDPSYKDNYLLEISMRRGFYSIAEYLQKDERVQSQMKLTKRSKKDCCIC